MLQGKAQLAAAGKGAPAMDLLESAQIDVFVERLFPECLTSTRRPWRRRLRRRWG